MSSTGHRSHNYSQGSRTMDKESMHRVRAMAQRERRTMPPTFRPLLIVIVTLAIGLLLVGLVMIIIAHWPGISGGEGLKIAGGCLVAGGGVALICAIVFICVKKNMEKEQFERSLANIAHTRSNISIISRPTITPTPSMDAKPNKSILKKTPSTSTYGTRNSDLGEPDSDQSLTMRGNNFSQSYGSEESDMSAGQHGQYKIETMPDPSRTRQNGHRGYQNGPMGAPMEQSSTDSDQVVVGVPNPVRPAAKKRGPRGSRGQTNSGYSADPGDADTSRDQSMEHSPRGMQSYTTHGYDMYDPNPQQQQQQLQPAQLQVQQPQQQLPPTGPRHSGRRKKRERTAEGGERPRRRRERSAEPHDTSADQAQMVHAGSGSLVGAGMMGMSGSLGGMMNDGYTPEHGAYPDMNTQVVSQQTVTDDGHVTQYTRTTTSYQQQVPDDPYQHQYANPPAAQDPLRINIKAQPGTSVHITPGRQQQQQQRAQRQVTSPSASSVETEI